MCQTTQASEREPVFKNSRGMFTPSAIYNANTYTPFTTTPQAKSVNRMLIAAIRNPTGLERPARHKRLRDLIVSHSVRCAVCP